MSYNFSSKVDKNFLSVITRMYQKVFFEKIFLVAQEKTLSFHHRIFFASKKKLQWTRSMKFLNFFCWLPVENFIIIIIVVVVVVDYVKVERNSYLHFIQSHGNEAESFLVVRRREKIPQQYAAMHHENSISNSHKWSNSK